MSAFASHPEERAPSPVVSPTCQQDRVFGAGTAWESRMPCRLPTAFFWETEPYLGGGTTAFCKHHAIEVLDLDGLREYAELSL